FLHRPRGPEAGALARRDGCPAAGGGERRQPAGGVPQPGLRLRAAGPARRSRGRLRRSGYAGAAGRLDRARELFGKVPPPAWFWARTLSAAGAGEFELAEELAEEGAEAFPSH